jgi:DNA modification methylase
MVLLLNGDCLEEMKSIDNNSIDLIFCDLPYGQTSCKWDCKIDLDLFWKEVMRIKKLNTPIFMTTTTKFGVELINSCPKKCPFRYDVVWVKSAPAGFLSAKKMPMRKHEMVYVFYEKLPFYDLSSHKHKFIKETVNKKNGKDGVDNKGMIKNRSKTEIQNKYDPPLPVSVVKEDLYGQTCDDKNNYEESVGMNKKERKEVRYDPPLPVSVVKEDLYGQDKDYKEKIYDEKYGKKGKNQVLYDPPLPVSVVKEESKEGLAYKPSFSQKDNADNQYRKMGRKGGESAYDPPLPTTMLEIKSTRGKHSTEKPVALMEWILKYYSKEGDVVLDPTMGSGSTGVACKNLNRDFIGIELDKEIYNKACDRIK